MAAVVMASAPGSIGSYCCIFERRHPSLLLHCNFVSILQCNADIYRPDCSLSKHMNRNTLSPFLTPDRGYLSVNRPA